MPIYCNFFNINLLLNKHSVNAYTLTLSARTSTHWYKIFAHPKINIYYFFLGCALGVYDHGRCEYYISFNKEFYCQHKWTRIFCQHACGLCDGKYYLWFAVFVFSSCKKITNGTFFLIFGQLTRAFSVYWL